MPINSTHPDYQRMTSKWKRCRDAASGQDAVQEAGETYLPRLSGQSDDEYKAYKMRAGFYNATWRTISGLVGMVMRQPSVTVLPPAVEPFTEDINLAGLSLEDFAQNVLEEAITVGRVGLLTDCPPMVVVDGASPTLADAQAQNVRPTIQLYRAESIINWKTSRINNAMMLTLVVLEESEETPTDSYSSKTEKRWRELSLENGVYRQRIFKRENDVDVQVGTDIFPVMNGASMKYIPFVFVSTDDLTPEVDDPPLIDLVDVNLAHYRITADYEHGCHFTGLPTPVVTGYTKTDPSERFVVGSSHAWVFPSPETNVRYLEFSGQGLSVLTENLARKEQMMAVLGARMLEPQRKAAEAADSASIHRKGEESMLAAAAQTVSHGIETSLQWMTRWMGIDPEADATDVDFDFNRDFYPAPMNPSLLSTIMSAWQSGMPGFSDQGVFAMLKQGQIIQEDVTLEEEQARIEARQLSISQFNQALQGGDPAAAQKLVDAQQPQAAGADA